jgi:DNA-binding transcriptional LysR family regulator
MNVTLARTFLEIVEAKNLSKAADRLNVTQSTVTMRLNTLEEMLGQKLFIRSKAGAELTYAGFMFQRHAEMMVQIWRQAGQAVSLPTGFAGIFSIGCHQDLWEGTIDRWTAALRRKIPNLALVVWPGDADALTQWLFNGLCDVALTYGLQLKSGIEVTALFKDELVLVSRQPRSLETIEADYVYVDWGEEFRRQHAVVFPDRGTPALTFGTGSFALQHILHHGGAGYLPLRTVAPYLTARTLHLVGDAPRFARQVYLAFAPALERRPEAIDILKQIVAEDAAPAKELVPAKAPPRGRERRRKPAKIHQGNRTKRAI